MNKEDSSENTESTATSKVESPYLQIIVLTLATFTAGLGSSVVSVSFPKIAGSLGALPTEVIWIITAYIVAAAAILPVSGWLATYFGRKNYYMTSVAVFTAASVLCGISTSLETLIFFRILQGLAAGGLAASEQAIIADITPREKLGRAFSIYAFAIFFAPVLGPTLGGFITDTFGWHWIFFINLPIGILSFFLTATFVKESEQAEKATREFRESNPGIDWLGIFLFVTGIATLQIVLFRGPREGWFDSGMIFFLAFYSFLSLVIGIAWEYYHKSPIIDLSMFKLRGFTAALILAVFISFGGNGVVLMLPVLTQDLLGYSALDSGLISLPGTITQLIVIQIVGYYIDIYDSRRFIMFGVVSIAVTYWYFSTLSLDAGFNDLVIGKVMQLFCLAFVGASVNTTAYYGLPADKNNSASALLNLAVTMGGSTGLAIVSTFVAVRTEVYVQNSNDHLSLLNPNYLETISSLTRSFSNMGLTLTQATTKAQSVVMDMVVKEANMNAIIDGFVLLVIMQLCLIPVVFLLNKRPDLVKSK